MEFSPDVEMQRVSSEAEEFFEKVLYDEEPLFVSDEATLWGVWMGVGMTHHPRMGAVEEP